MKIKMYSKQIKPLLVKVGINSLCTGYKVNKNFLSRERLFFLGIKIPLLLLLFKNICNFVVY